MYMCMQKLRTSYVRTTMAPWVVATLLVLCCLLLLPAQYDGASSHENYSQVFFKTPGRSSGNSQQASTVPPAAPCSSVATAGLGNNKLPVVHLQSPCSPLHGLPYLTTADVLRRDSSLIRRRLSSLSSSVAAPAPDPSPGATIIPINGSLVPSSRLPGSLVGYSVLVSYGTPGQQFPLFLDNTAGMSILRCKPCASGSDDCDPAFDTSRSSTFAHIPCGSPECPTNYSGSACPFVGLHVPVQGSFARDLLTLPQSSIAVHDFTFVCADEGLPPSSPLPEVGILDLSRNHNSLPSRLSSTSLPAFSYCLPQSLKYQGFVYLGGDATVRHDGNSRTVHAPLVTSGDPELASMYFVDLVGMSLFGKDLPIPSETFGGSNGGTNVDVGTTITKLPPDAYTPLRDAFLEQMSQYNNLSSPGFAGLDTCFNFTGLQELTIPLVEFKFSNGESLLIDMDQMLYYDEPAAAPFTIACLAFSSMDDAGDATSAVIGAYTLASMEVVYDVAGGKVAFIPWSC